MYGSSGAHELGYASMALMIGLIRTLRRNGTITKQQETDILNDATGALGPMGHVSSIAAAIRMIETDVKAQIAA